MAELDATLPYRDDGSLSSTPGAIGRYAVLGSIGGGGMGIVLRAHDAELGRDLAIKVLRPELGAGLLEREAQAMAKLSHPNVVTIYEVGRFDGRPFIAMELVVGETLRAWMATRRPWREVVAMFVAAGHGLVAAHAEGLVHRDFKPENVLIGRDGRPRVGDFGLVAAGEGSATGDTPAATTITTHGAAGTPAYMAPEQWLGEDVDARADQFAFAVALWEALWAARPFAGDTVGELRSAVIRDERELRIADRRGVPRRIELALRRALARRRDERWPELRGLLAELASVLGRRRIVWLAAGGGAAVAAVAAVVVATQLASAPASCPVPDRAAAIWGPDVRDRIASHVVAIDPVLGRARLAAADARLTAAVAEWETTSVEACRANRIDGHDSDTLYDARVRCLESWLDELQFAAGQFEQAGDPAAIDRAVVVARQLSSLARCRDTKTLAQAPPAPPEHRAEAEAIRHEVARAYLDRSGGAPRAPIVARLKALVERARAIGHAPTLAMALHQYAEALIAVEDLAGARAALEETAAVAAQAGDDDTTAIAWTTSVRVLHMMRRPDEARQLIPVARTAVTRAGNDIAQQVALYNYEASLIAGRGESERALALLETARELLVDAGAETPGSEHASNLASIMLATGNAYGNARRYDDSIAMTRRAIALREKLYGPDHPDLVDAYLNLAETYRRAGREADSFEAAREGARVAEAREPRSSALARAWNKLARAQLQRRQSAEALALNDKAIALLREVAPDNTPQLAGMLGDRALALRFLGRYDEAIAAYDELIALIERTGLKPADPSSDLFNRAGTRKEKGDFAGALVDYRRAREIAEQGPEELAFRVLPPLIGEGECLVHLKRPAEAIAPLERAVAVKAPPAVARNQPIARFMLARALAESRRDVPRAIREAFTARDEIMKSKTNLDWIGPIGEFIDATDPTRKYGPK